MYYPIKKETIIRTIVLIIAIINNILTLLGKNPLPYESEEVEQAVTIIITVIATLWAWWKNNSFTLPARMGDEEMIRQRIKRRLYKKGGDLNV